jgi:hypothetical protein
MPPAAEAGPTLSLPHLPLARFAMPMSVGGFGRLARGGAWPRRAGPAGEAPPLAAGLLVGILPPATLCAARAGLLLHPEG